MKRRVTPTTQRRDAMLAICTRLAICAARSVPREDVLHIFVLQLREVLVPLADAEERRRRGEADERSASAERAVQASFEATGTATTIRAAWRRRSESTAARIVQPVAIPSSTTIAQRPATSSGGRFRRNAASRRASSSSSRCAARAISPGVTTAAAMV